jgi:hypothetical protein
MAIDSNAWGTRVANAVQSVGVMAGVPVTSNQLEQIWQAIKAEDKTEMTVYADIDLPAGDVQVPALGLLDSLSAPVTGTAQSAATGPLNARIK